MINNAANLIIIPICEILRLFVVRNYSKIFYGRNKNAFLCTMAYFIAFVLTILPGMFIHILSAGVLPAFAGLFIIALTYEGSIKKKIFCSLILLVIRCFLDLISVIIMTGIHAAEHYDTACSFFSMFLFFLSSIAARRLLKREKTKFGWEWWYVLILTCCVLGLVIFLSYDTAVEKTTAVLVCVMLFAAILVMYDFCLSLSDKYLLRKENLELKKQMDIYEYGMKKDIKKDEAIRTMRHDMKHHVMELYNFINDNKKADALEYLDKMGHQIKLSSGKVSTGVKALDDILEYMITEAEENKIDVSTHIVVPNSIDISSYDMNIIFGNLMENAIEAAKNCEAPKICVYVRYNYGCLFIKITNTYEGKLVKKEGEYISTKPDKERHGLGLKSVKNTIDKYAGSFEANGENGIFAVRVMLVLNNIGISSEC